MCKYMNDFYDLANEYEKNIHLTCKCMECKRTMKFGESYNVPCDAKCFLYHKVVCKRCHDKFMKKY
ncbi:MAG: hypothetical protein IKJ03_00945 [Mycoplasmataceae bacterium]|nr:hypothetical protein [Mycoplasmataceae bacterium]